MSTALPIVKVTEVKFRVNEIGVVQPGYCLSLSCGHEAIYDRAVPANMEPAIGDEIPCRACGWAAKGVDPALDPGGEDEDDEEGP